MEMKLVLLTSTLGFPGGSDSEESAHNVGDPSLIPGLRISSGKRNGYSPPPPVFLPGELH